MKLTGWLTPEEFWNEYNRIEARIRTSSTEMPCYGLSGWSGPVAVGEWDPPMTVGLAHGTNSKHIQTVTTSQEPRKVVGLRRMSAGGPQADGADFYRRPAALEADAGEEIDIPIEGVNTTFSFWRDAEHWWAAADYRGRGVILQGLNMEPEGLSLQLVQDLEPYLAGRRTQIRLSRGELRRTRATLSINSQRF